MSNLRSKTRSIADLFVCFFGAIVWSAHFLVMYTAGALICSKVVAADHERQFQILATVATSMALVSLLCFLTWQSARIRRGHSAIGNSAGPQFLRITSIMLAALAMLGVLWVALPVVLLPACLGHSG